MNGPEDFEAIPHFTYSSLEKATPEACCQRELQSREGMFVDKEACLAGIERFQNRQVRGADHQEKEFHSGKRGAWGGHGQLAKLAGHTTLTHPNYTSADSF